MQFHVRFDESIDTYDKMRTVMERQSGNPGAQSVITQTEYDKITECFYNILQYYRDYFEIESYAGDENTYECDVLIDFEAGFDPEKLQELKVEQLLQNSENEAHPDEKELDTILAKLIRMNKNSRDHEESTGMIEGSRDHEESTGKNEDRRDHEESTGKNEDRRDHEKLAGMNTDIRVHENMTGINTDIRDHEKSVGMIEGSRYYEDLMGEYADGRIRIFWPRICLLATICARRNRLPEAEERLFLFEEALAHELFHFFLACCVGEGFREPYNVYISHMAECLAEFFCKKYMGHISRKRDQEAQLVGIPRDPWNFYPGGESSDGGYSGAAILLDSLGHQEDMHNSFYVKLFNSVCSADKAQEACEGLKKERNFQFGLF